MDNKNNPNNQRLLNDIDLGLWDDYLCWSIEAYQNVKSQNIMTQILTAKLANNDNSSIVANTIPPEEEQKS